MLGSLQKKQSGAALVTVMLVAAIATILLTLNITDSYKLSLQERALQNQTITKELFRLAELDGMYKLEQRLSAGSEQFAGADINHLVRSRTPLSEHRSDDYPGWTYRVYLNDLQAGLNINLLERNQTYQHAFSRLVLGLNAPEIDAIVDWLDADDLESSLGAEDYDYLANPSPYLPANQPMLDASEIRMVKGMSAEDWFTINKSITALPTQAHVNIHTASEEVLRALAPQLDATQIVAKRRSQAQLYVDKNDMALSNEFSGAANSSNLFVLKSDYYELEILIDNSTSHYRMLSRIQLENGSPSIYQRAPGLDIPETIILGEI